MEKSKIEARDEKAYAVFEKKMDEYKLEDSGAVGKSTECALRTFSSGRENLKVKAQGRVDVYFAHGGKHYKTEIKTACGKITETLKTRTKTQVVVYSPHTFNPKHLSSEAYVFTREEWLDFVNGYTGRGSLTAKRGDEIYIQSFYVSETVRPKASKPLARYIFEACQKQPTLAEWLD